MMSSLEIKTGSDKYDSLTRIKITGHGKRSGPAVPLIEMEKPEFVLQESPEKYSRTKQQQSDGFNGGDRAGRLLPLPLPLLMRSSFGNAKILGIPNSILIPLESHRSALNEQARNDDDTMKDTSEYLSSFMANMPEMVSSKHL